MKRKTKKRNTMEPKKRSKFDDILRSSSSKYNKKKKYRYNFDSLIAKNNTYNNFGYNYMNNFDNNSYNSYNNYIYNNNDNAIKENNTHKQSIQCILNNMGFNDNIDTTTQQTYNDIALAFVREVLNESMIYTQTRGSNTVTETDIERSAKKYNIMSHEQWLQIKIHNKQQQKKQKNNNNE